MDVTWWRCRADSSFRTVPIGYPVANTQIHILDQWLQPVPVLVSGELYIGGIAVGRGYLGRPDLTAASFIPDPCTADAGQRMYRTGDIARRLPDGSIEFVARRDDQVKIRGFRIEPGEIDSVLRQHPAVRDCAVLPERQTDGEQRLVAFLVIRSDGNAGVRDLRAFLQARLPDYMVPARLMFLSELPKTLSGKVDRVSLLRETQKSDAERLLEQVEGLSEDEVSLLLAGD